MEEYKVKVEIDLSDSLKKFIKSLIPNNGIEPISNQEWDEVFSKPEVQKQIEEQPDSSPEITREELLTIGGKIAQLKDGNKTIIKILDKYGAKSLPQLNSIHYPKVYKDFLGVLDAA